MKDKKEGGERDGSGRERKLIGRKLIFKNLQYRSIISTPLDKVQIHSQGSVISILNNYGCTSERLRMDAGNSIYCKTE